MTANESFALATLFTAYLIPVIICSVVITVLNIIAMWKIFRKAGERGWKILIPIYNLYILFKIVWSKKAFWSYFTLTIITSILSSILSVVINREISDTLYYILLVVGGVIGLILLIMSLMVYFKLSKSFGHGFGFFLGLVFLEYIFILILGFGGSKYIGPGGEKKLAR